MTKKRVLFAPLNWGLGHAVRSIPVLKELSASGFEIILAGNGFSLEYLRREFPGWEYVVLPSFEMRYSGSNSQLFSVLKALPEIISASWKEHRRLRHLVKEKNIDIVISDNRFGFFNKNCTSVYITHQLTIPLPAGFRFLTPVARKLHRMVMGNFTCCWIPDEPGDFNLSGKLSHNQILPENARFIGVLSRFRKADIQVEKKIDFLFILSGVEPQRTMLEDKIMALFQENNSHKAVLVRGVSCKKNQRRKERVGELTIINQASEKELKTLLDTSEVVVCRSGYTSIMELASLAKRAVLIPTPGQPEQEYLAEYLSVYPLFACVKQAEFTFSNLLLAAGKTESYPFVFSPGLLANAIQTLNLIK